MTPQAIRHTLLLSSAIACTLVSVYHIFNLGRFTGFTMFNVQFVYLFMTLSVPLVFLLKPARLSRRDEQIPWYDFGLAGITVLCLAYFTAAADELNVTQGAVSRMVQALEQDLEVPLFERKGRFLTLTATGQRYFEEVSAALTAIATASGNLRAQVAEDSVSVVVNSGFASRWLIPRLASFNHANPGLRIDIVPTEQDVRGVNPGQFVAIRYGLGDWPSYDAVDLGLGSRLAVVCAPALDERMGPLERLEDLTERPLLTYSAVARDPWVEFLDRHGLSADCLGRATHYYQLPLLAEAAIAGYGYGLLPLCLIERELQNGDLTIVPGTSHDSDRRYFLTYLRQGETSQRIRRFEQWLMREVQRTSIPY